MLELTGREALGVHVGEFFELERTFERHRIADVPADEQHGGVVGERSGQLTHRIHGGQHLGHRRGHRLEFAELAGHLV